MKIPATFLACTVEMALNKALSAADADYALLLKPLLGQSVLIEISDWALQLTVLTFPDQLAVRINTETTADVALRGTLAQWTALSLSLPEINFARHGIQVQGNLGTLQAYQRLWEQLNLSPQSLLANGLGNTVSLALWQPLQALGRQLRQQCQSTRQDITETLQEEKRLLVSQEELNDFIDDCYALRERVERLKASLKTKP